MKNFKELFTEAKTPIKLSVGKKVMYKDFDKGWIEVEITQKLRGGNFRAYGVKVDIDEIEINPEDTHLYKETK